MEGWTHPFLYVNSVCPAYPHSCRSLSRVLPVPLGSPHYDGAMSPSSHPILPLLYCPSCPPRTFLSNPITQKSGITLCSHHAAESSTSSPALPFDAPKAPIASAAVAFYPAQSTETTLPPIDVKVDVTVNKILNLVQRWLLESDPDTTTSQQSSDDSLQRLQDSLVSELTCEICFSLLHQPVTTPCQHTFCSSCLQRSIDHSTICPLCRQDLPGYAYFQLHPHNRLISNIRMFSLPCMGLNI
jgi:hypothetical protein